MMSGEATPSQMGGLLMALRVRGETVDEITGAVTAMRAKMLRVAAPADAIDVVGTGGDASGSYNISTCAAFIVAGAGVPVAKHGNRALSSHSGAADVLAALGVKIDLTPDGDRALHPRGRHRLHVRAGASSGDEECRRRPGSSSAPAPSSTCSGPLSNPAGVKRQMVGVFSRQWVEPLAEVLKNLGSERAWVVHGSDGLDEITTCGPDQRRRAGERRGAHLRDHAGGGRACRAPSRRSCAAATPTPTRRRCCDVLKGKKGAVSATSRCSMPAAGAGGRRQAPRI